METIRFARPGSSKALGCVVYALLALALGGLLAILAAGLAAWAMEKCSDAVRIASASVAGLGVFALIARFAWRDFRRRANAEVVVAPDAIVVASGLGRAEIPYGEVETVLLRFDGWEPSIELRAGDGRRARLPVDLAPLVEVEPYLRERLLPKMLERFEAELGAGRTLDLREGGARAVGRIFYGLFLLLLAPFMIVSIRLMGRGFQALGLGIARIRQGWRGRGGGFTVTAEGVLPPGEEARALPWRELTLETLDEHGVALASMEGPRVSASMFATNFWALSRLIAERLK